METRATIDDLWASHEFLNVLHSQFQGWVAWQNTLVQLRHPLASEEQLGHLKSVLDWLSGWRGVLVRERFPLLRADGSSDHPVVVGEAGNIGVTLLRCLVEVGAATRDLGRRSAALEGDSDEVKYLVAVYAWSAYSFQHAVHSDVRFGEIFGDEQLADRMRQHLLAAQERVHTANVLVAGFAAAGELEPALLDLVRAHAPGLAEPDRAIGAAVLQVDRILKRLGRTPVAGAAA
jgi:hypothetical protein